MTYHLAAPALSVLLAALAVASPLATSEVAPNQPPKAAAAPAPPPEPTTPTPPADSWEVRGGRFGGDEWITRASRDVPMGFTISLEVQQIPVKAGQAVKAGQLLVRGRDGEILAGLAVQKARAENDTEVKNALAQQELAQTRFDAVQKVMSQDAGTAAEFDERRIALDSARIGVEAARKKLEEQVLEHARLTEQAARYRLEAPFDGVIDTLAVEVGQTATERDPILRVVKIDPLWIDVPVKTSETIRQSLDPDHLAWVLLDLPGEPVVLSGKVLYVSSVADSSSGTRRVRVEVSNPQRWPAGTRARVRFTDPGPEWTARKSAAAAPAPANAPPAGSVPTAAPGGATP